MLKRQENKLTPRTVTPRSRDKREVNEAENKVNKAKSSAF